MNRSRQKPPEVPPEVARAQGDVAAAEAMLQVVKILAPLGGRSRRRILAFLADAVKDGTNADRIRVQLQALERVADVLGIELADLSADRD